MFYLNTIEQLFLLVEQLDQLEICLPYSRLLTGIQILAVFQNLRWNSNKTSLFLGGLFTTPLHLYNPDPFRPKNPVFLSSEVTKILTRSGVNAVLGNCPENLRPMYGEKLTDDKLKL